MNVLITDGHKINRLFLKKMLEDNFSVIKKIDEAATVSESLRLIEMTEYDIVFLEMELKDGLGFDVLKKTKDFTNVIVVTNHKEYAIKAFKENVLDYLLKPVDTKELMEAVKRVLKLQQVKELKAGSVSANGFYKTPEDSSESLMVNYKNQYVAINKKDIVFIKALGKYSEIHVMPKKQYISYKNLKEFEQAMPDFLVRIHHSYLVNSSCIVSYSRDTSHVLLSSGEEIPVSVRKREELFKKFRVF